MTIKHTEVIEEVLNKLKEQENVIGVLLFGSLANKTSHAYSDIDLFVVGHNELHRTECFNQNGIQVQIIWRSPNLFKDKIMIRTRTYPISNSCKILYDKSGEILEIVELSKKQIDLGPIKLSKQEKISKLVKSNNLGVLAESIIMETDINKKMDIFRRFRKEILDIYGSEISNYELMW